MRVYGVMELGSFYHIHVDVSVWAHVEESNGSITHALLSLFAKVEGMMEVNSLCLFERMDLKYFARLNIHGSAPERFSEERGHVPGLWLGELAFAAYPSCDKWRFDFVHEDEYATDPTNSSLLFSPIYAVHDVCFPTTYGLEATIT